MKSVATTTVPCVVLVVGSMIQHANALSQSVSFPLTQSYKGADSLLSSFERIVDCTDFFVPCPVNRGAFSVPALGNTQVTFGVRNPQEFVLTADDTTEDHFGWICKRVQECESMLDGGVCTSNLKELVSQHQDNQRLVPPGFDASEAKLAGSQEIANLFQDEHILKSLERDGFVVIKSSSSAVPKVSPRANAHLSEFLVEKSGQNGSIRTDTIAFLDRNDAQACGLQHQYDVLMGIASHLNDNMSFKPCAHAARLPGTKSKPLTNPGHIQAAEYGENDFYVAHKDNSFKNNDKDNLSNYRHTTCILYCNDDWTEEDGGALRIYPNSQHVAHPDEAVSMPYVDVLPHNGDLLIFDSTLVHSVEKVTQSSKPRRALTIWLNRPVHSGIKDKELHYTGKGRSWTKQEQI